MHSTTLGDVLREHRRSWPAQVAAVCGEQRYRYPELDDRVNRLANGMRQRGFERGDRILWIGQNCHRLLEALGAASKLGGVLCPINWRQTADEIAFVIGDLEPRLVLWQSAEIGETASRARALASDVARTLWVQHDGEARDGYEAWLAGADPRDPDLDVDAASPVMCLYTAAFAGKPRGALLSHTALLVQALVAARFRDIDSSYVYLNCGPLFHVATFMFTAATLLSAGTNVFTPRSDAETICRLVDAEKCTGAFVMGPTIDKIVEVNRAGRYDMKSLRAYPASPEFNAMVTRDASAAGRAPGGYGQTELTGLLTLGALGGRPIPFAQVRIAAEDGRELPPGEVGEILARGPTVMNGYIDEPTRSDWHRTGDLGRREADGSVRFIGPKARLIKSAAENIYPAEVEACLREHAAVADSAVIGVPDATWGQSVKAIVVLRAGCEATPADLIEHCRARIASYKKPRAIEIVDALPRRGHLIDYDALDRRFGGGGYPGAPG